jgi:hypothetical protein
LLVRLDPTWQRPLGETKMLVWTIDLFLDNW